MFFRKTKAPELVGLNDKSWINSKPLSLENLKGKAVLLDFWTYSCVNCIRTLPALKEMWKKYKDKRFVIIGVHTPEFDFEKEIGNVKYAVKKHGIEYPVVNDPERRNWERYGNKYWPRAALINAEGEVIFDHVGESGYDKIEKKLIEELKRLREIDDVEGIKEERREYSSDISPETYAGSSRNSGLGSGTVCTPEGCDEYVDSGDHEKNIIYLKGEWVQKPEYLELKGKEGHIVFRYSASEVNVVLSGNGEVEVLVDDKPISKSSAGDDVVFKGKQSFVKVDGADMYRIVASKNFHESELKLNCIRGVKVYAYTFG